MRFIYLFISLLLAAPSHAQHSDIGSGDAMDVPHETGQSGFTTLAEIVAILRGDPRTDWSTVNIAALRQHLVDMDLLTTDSEIDVIKRREGARFEIRGTPRVLEAIRAMVPAHAPFLAAETGWDVSTEEIEGGLSLIVDGDPGQIQGLGFFGVMTIGAHHQQHHLMLAKGAAPHR